MGEEMGRGVWFFRGVSPWLFCFPVWVGFFFFLLSVWVVKQRLPKEAEKSPFLDEFNTQQ